MLCCYSETGTIYLCLSQKIQVSIRGLHFFKKNIIEPNHNSASRRWFLPDATGQDSTLLCLPLTETVRGLVRVSVFNGVRGLTRGNVTTLSLCVSKWAAKKKLPSSVWEDLTAKCDEWFLTRSWVRNKKLSERFFNYWRKLNMDCMLIRSLLFRVWALTSSGSTWKRVRTQLQPQVVCMRIKGWEAFY